MKDRNDAYHDKDGLANNYSNVFEMNLGSYKRKTLFND